MRCPACGSPATKQEVHKTVDVISENKRWRRCLCGARWVTSEKMIRGTLIVTGDPPVTVLKVTGDPSVSFGGGGVLPSGLFPSLSGSLEASGSEVVRKISSAVPPADFMEVWKATGQVGVRAKALKAWTKNGRPTWSLIGSKYAEYLRSQRPVDGFIMDLSTWLNARGWEQEWPAGKNARPGATGSVSRPSTGPVGTHRPLRCSTHEKNPKWDNRQPVDWCGCCREQMAKNGTRSSEPTSFADVLPAWAQSKGQP